MEKVDVLQTSLSFNILALREMGIPLADGEDLFAGLGLSNWVCRIGNEGSS